MLWNCSKSNLKNMFVQLHHLPRDRDENSKNIYLQPPPRFKLSASEFHFPKSHNALRLSSFREVVLRTSCIRILRPWHQLQNVAKSINPEASIWWSAPVQKAQFHQPNHAWVFWFFLPPLALLLDSLALLGEIFLGAIIGISQKLDKAQPTSATVWQCHLPGGFNLFEKYHFPKDGGENKTCLKPSPKSSCHHKICQSFMSESWPELLLMVQTSGDHHPGCC